MRISSLSKLISGEMDVSGFDAEIRDEFEKHSKELQKIGGIAPVSVTEDQEFTLDRSGIGALCRLFIGGQITATKLAYIADAMQLSEGIDFSDAEIADDVALLTDPEINGPLTIERALRIANGPSSD
jgi:hypothetical protein